MFDIDDRQTIYLTRGDVAYFGFTIMDKETKEPYTFEAGDVVRLRVFGKKSCNDVVLDKSFLVESSIEEVEILLEKEDTRIGEVINKPKTYWYEIELNPDSMPLTAVGYERTGPKLLILLPEGVSEPEEIVPEQVSPIDSELDVSSERPVCNRAIASAIADLADELYNLRAEIAQLKGEE